MIRKPIMAYHAFFALVTFSKINSFVYVYIYQFYRDTAFIISNLQKDFYQDNLSFVCLQFYLYNCLNILADTISGRIQAKGP